VKATWRKESLGRAAVRTGARDLQREVGDVLRRYAAAGTPENDSIASISRSLYVLSAEVLEAQPPHFPAGICK
jgi:hypothetical protein